MGRHLPHDHDGVGLLPRLPEPGVNLSKGTPPHRDALLRDGGADAPAPAPAPATRAAPDSPLVAVLSRRHEAERVRRELLVQHGVAVTDLHVLVLPPVPLITLGPRHEAGLGDVEGHGGEEAAADEVDGVVVREVHGGPPDPNDVAYAEGPQAGEAVRYDERLEDGVAGVHAGEGAEGDGGGREGRRVHVEAEDGVDARQARGGTRHPVRGGREAALVLVPGRRAGEEQLDRHARDVHPAERPREDGGGAGRREEEEGAGADSRQREVQNAIGEPGEEVEGGEGVGGEDVGEVCAVEDVFEGREDADPDVRAEFGGDESIKLLVSVQRRKCEEGTYRLEKK